MRLQLPGLTLDGVAQGGRRTSFLVEEAGILFDAGDFSGGPLKSRKVFLTHCHPDHVGALPLMIAQHSMDSYPTPFEVFASVEDAANLDALLASLDNTFGGRRLLNTNVHALKVGDRVPTRRQDLVVEALRSFHGVPSRGYALILSKKKLRPEFVGLSSNEIVDLRKKGVDVTEVCEDTLLTVSGDTQIEFLLREKKAQKAKVLVHEVTLYTEDSRDLARQYGHTHVLDMIEHCEKFEGDYLVLVHRSQRSTLQEAEAIVRTQFPASMRSKVVFFGD